MPMQILKTHQMDLRRQKRRLEEINEALLDPTIPVKILYPELEDSPFGIREWEMEEVEAFKKLSPTEKRPFIKQQLTEEVEKVSVLHGGIY